MACIYSCKSGTSEGRIRLPGYVEVGIYVLRKMLAMLKLLFHLCSVLDLFTSYQVMTTPYLPLRLTFYRLFSRRDLIRIVQAERKERDRGVDRWRYSESRRDVVAAKG